MCFTSVDGVVRRPNWRDITIAAVANGISYTGDFLAATALLLGAQSAGAGGATAAALLIAAALPPTVLAPLTGRLVDRVDSRVLLVGVGLAQASCCVALAFATSTVMVIALIAVLASGLAVTSPTFSALVPAMAGREHLARAAAVGQTAVSLGAVAGPALAGVLFGAFGPRVPLLLDAASYLAVVAAGLALRTRRNAESGRAARAARAVPGVDADRHGPAVPAAVPGWRLTGDRLLLRAVAMVGLVFCAVSSVNVAEVFFVRVELNASPGAFGLLAAVWTVAMLAGSWSAARWITDDDRRLVWMLVVAIGALAAAVMLGGVAPDIWWFALLWAVGGVGNGVGSATMSVLLGRRIPAEARGRGFAAYAGAMNAAGLVGYALGGALLGRVPAGGILLACGAAGLVVTALTAPSLVRGAAQAMVRGAAQGSAVGPGTATAGRP